MSLFKAYDLRGQVPAELNESIAYKIGRAYCELYHPQTIAIGRDIRLESPAIANALAEGLIDGGANVLDIGLCGTEEIYFATFHHETDGGIMVTASHNPKGYNGMKLVTKGARPISGDNGLFDIRDRINQNEYSDQPSQRGEITTNADKSDYIQHLLGYIDLDSLKPLKIVVNPGNGGAGLVVKALENTLPFKFVYINDTPDGNFPNGVPNPLLPENQKATADAVLAHQADLGIAWDGDFDRCFFFDAKGQFIEGYYLVGLLAEMMLLKDPGAKIIHDPRLTWNTQEQTRQNGGIPIQSKCGHAFIKQVMREQDAVYGGEMSAHHYFRDFAYCDSGMIPWLLITELLCRSDQSLASLVEARIAAFPCSGEINFRVEDTQTVINRIRAEFESDALAVDTSDGISLSFDQWRFNLRASNTEPLLRLNVEAKNSDQLMQAKLHELTQLIQR